MSPGLSLRVPLPLAGGRVQAHDRARVLRGEVRVLLRRLPRGGVHVGAEEERVRFRVVGRRGPDAARRRPGLERVLAPVALHDDGRVELLRLRPDVVLPDHLAGLRFERHDEPATGAAGVPLGAGEELFERPAARRSPCRRPGSARPSGGCSSGCRGTPWRGCRSSSVPCRSRRRGSTSSRPCPRSRRPRPRPVPRRRCPRPTPRRGACP